MLKLFKLVARVMFAAIIVFVGLPANADPNLVLNGDFSVPPPPLPIPDWSLTGDTTFTGVITGGSPPHQSYFFTASPGALTQTLTTVSGQQYFISFDVQAESGTTTGAFLSASFDGVGGIFSTPDGPFDWMTFTFTETALTNSSVLGFTYSNDNSFYDLTNVSVTAVPEPEVYAMMGVGLLLMGFVVHSRRNA